MNRIVVLLSLVFLSSAGMAGDSNLNVNNVSKFSLDLMQGGEAPASNWFSINGGATILHQTNKTTGVDQFNKAPEISFSEVTVVGPFVKGGTRAELLHLLNTWATGEGERFNATLQMSSLASGVVRTIHLMECVPMSYIIPPASKAKKDEVAMEELFMFLPGRVQEFAGSSTTNNVQKKSVLIQSSNIKSKQNNKKLRPKPLAASVETDIITGRTFKFEFDGQELDVLRVQPGAMKLDIKEVKKDENNPKQDHFKTFTVTKPSFETWRVEKLYDQGDSSLRDLFQSFATGQRKMNPSDAGSFIYLDRNGNEARRVNFFGFVPTHYESISLDSRNSGQAATEVLEFEVQRCEYL